MAIIRVAVIRPHRQSNATRLVVRPGKDIELRAEDADANPIKAGNWKHKKDDATELPEGATERDGVLKFTMDETGTREGVYYFATAAEKSGEIKVMRRWSLRDRVLPGALLLLATAAIYIVVVWALVFREAGSSGPQLTRLAYLFAAATLGFALFVVALAANAGSEQQGLAGLFVGADRRASTSKVQYLMWTLGIAFALAYIGGRVLINSKENFICPADQDTPVNCVPMNTWEAYLILLGVPAAAAVIARGTVSAKTAKGDVQKTEADNATLSDIITDDARQADIYDIQYLIFNVIAFVFVAVSFIRTGTLPAVPAILLGLTSAAGAAFVLNKSVQSNKPVITSVLPSEIAPGTVFKVQGRNLFPPGSDGLVTVKAGGIQAPPGEVRRLADDSIEAVAPPGMSQQDKTVRVITAAQAETNAYPVTIQDGLTVIGFVGPPPASGKPGKIRVQGLSADSNVEVAFGTVVTDGITNLQERTINVTVPVGFASGAEVPVRIGVEDRWGPTTKLKLG